MDVNAAWLELQNLVNSAHWSEAKEKAEDILKWLTDEGFAPRIGGHPTFDGLCAEATRQSIMRW